MNLNDKLDQINQKQEEVLRKLEEQKTALIDKRFDEIKSLFTQTGALVIDDKLLAGALLFLTNPDNKNHNIMAEFTNLAKESKIKLPSRRSSKK